MKLTHSLLRMVQQRRCGPIIILFHRFLCCGHLSLFPHHISTRSFATAEGLRDALCQLKPCRLLHSCTKKSHLKGWQ